MIHQSNPTIYLIILFICIISALFISLFYSFILNDILRRFNSSISFLRLFLFILVPVLFFPTYYLLDKLLSLPFAFNFSIFYEELKFNQDFLISGFIIYFIVVSLINFLTNRSLSLRDSAYSTLIISIFLFLGTVIASVVGIIGSVFLVGFSCYGSIGCS